jgi:hypothetical protein
MKHIFICTFLALAAAALFAGLIYGVLVAGQVSEPAAITVHGSTTRRLWATSVALLALAGVVLGGLALARPTGRFGTASVRIVTLVVGVNCAVNGGLVIALSNGGPGTGNGVVGGAAAVVLGVISTILGSVALSRHRGAR